MDFNTCFSGCPLGNPSGKEIMAVFIEPVSPSILDHDTEAGIQKDFQRRLDRRVSFLDNLKFFSYMFDKSHGLFPFYNKKRLYMAVPAI